MEKWKGNKVVKCMKIEFQTINPWAKPPFFTLKHISIGGISLTVLATLYFVFVLSKEGGGEKQ